MKAVDIHGRSGKSSILVGEELGNAGSYLPDCKRIIITDTTVNRLYGSQFPEAEVIEIGTGESVKTLDTAQSIYDRLVACGADRTSFLLGIGGGVVCDITGFAASTFMRGIRFGFVASTLLAQVDASVGGKNGVNFKGYKNMVGVFNQPEFVLCDPAMLETLPRKECNSGFAEIIKHAAIADKDMFVYLEENRDRALGLEAPVINQLVSESVRIKAGIVNRDETEQGERRKLNFGHTFGHAIEKTTGISHGEAVSIGMTLAARLSVARGVLPESVSNRLENLLKQYGLPRSIAIDRQRVLDALLKDKKRAGDDILFVLLDAIGKASVSPVSPATLAALLDG